MRKAVTTLQSLSMLYGPSTAEVRGVEEVRGGGACVRVRMCDVLFLVLCCKGRHETYAAPCFSVL